MQGLEHVKGSAGLMANVLVAAKIQPTVVVLDLLDSVGLSSVWGIEPAGTEV